MPVRSFPDGLGRYSNFPRERSLGHAALFEKFADTTEFAHIVNLTTTNVKAGLCNFSVDEVQPRFMYDPWLIRSRPTKRSAKRSMH